MLVFLRRVWPMVCLAGEYGGNYGPPSGFDWDVGNSDETIQDDPALEDTRCK